MFSPLTERSDPEFKDSDCLWIKNVDVCGYVNIPDRLSYSSLVGRKYADDLSVDAFVCEIQNGEPFILYDVCPNDKRRVRIYLPRIKVSMWIWSHGRLRSGSYIPNIHTKTEPDKAIHGAYSLKRGKRLDGPLHCFVEEKAGFLKSKFNTRKLFTLPRGDVLWMLASEEGTDSDLVQCRRFDLDVEFMCEREKLEDVELPYDCLARHERNVIDRDLLQRLNKELENHRETDLFAKVTQRDKTWTDILDPELCLLALEGKTEHPGTWYERHTYQWCASDVFVDSFGKCKFTSWVNHIPDTNTALISALEEGLGCLIPGFEAIIGHKLRNRDIQVIVRSYEQVLTDDNATYNISPWHREGYEYENIAAAGVLYTIYEVQGGNLEFTRQNERWSDDLTNSQTTSPGLGDIIVWNNDLLMHKVGVARGPGTRRIVAYFLVHPQKKVASAKGRARLAAHQQRQAVLRILDDVFDGAPFVELVWDMLQEGDSVEVLKSKRDNERWARTCPTNFGDIRRTTGITFRSTTTVHYPTQRMFIATTTCSYGDDFESDLS